MGDYIDRDAAIKAMLTRYWDGKETLREIMNSVPAVPSPWVSVNDRLPNHGECVLVYADSVELGVFDSRNNSFYHFWDGTKDDIYGVTHWMELPAPPSD